MKKFLLLIFLTSIIALSAKNEIVVKQNVQSLVNHGDNEGKTFFVAFPYNDSKNHPTQNIAIYVTSRFDTEVTIFNEEIGLNTTKNVKRGEITEFSSVKGGLGWDAEIYDFEKVVEKGFRITSKDPVKVYVLNSKSVSSEGYMAAPLRKWGTDYIHNGFYDFNEVREWAGGFVVLASEDDTEVNIKIVDGANLSAGFGETTRGSKHGDSVTITMNSGDVYAVQGTGTTRGVFDLSGSKITSNKPIALLSYHNRTMIPATVVTSGRDHIIEMIPPVDSWGTEYHSLELDRGKDKGDYFRVVAGEDDVTFEIVWYDKETNEKISKIGPITLQEKGNWFEYNGSGATMPHSNESIRGVAHFTSDGPILVSQYAYSANYDGAGGNFDPFMIVLPAVGQYTKDCIFQTPENYGQNEFRDNFVSIIAKGDPLDSANNYNLLSSLELDLTSLMNINPNFETNNIPNTDYYWVFVRDLNAGAHELKGDTEFGATIYGYANFDSYGWSVTHNVDDLVNTDTTSPSVEILSDDEKYVFKVDDRVEDTGGLNGVLSTNFGVGMNSMPELKPGSNNFSEPEYVNSDGDGIQIPKVLNQDLYFFSVEVIDKTKNATALLKVLDKNYNETEVAIYYTVPDFTVEVPEGGIIQGRVGVEANAEFSIKNNATEELVIENIYLSQSSQFGLSDITLPIAIEAESEFVWNVSFTPEVEYEGGVSTEVAVDLNIEAEDGAPIIKKITGVGVNPEVNVTNITFSPIEEKSGIHPEKGIVLIQNTSKNWFNRPTPLVINDIYFDENAPDSDLFTNIRLSTGESISDINKIVLDSNETLEINFDLNTDLAEVPGRKYSRLVVISDAGPADENGQIPVTSNNYGVEFDGNYTPDSPSGLNDGGYIQAVILEDTQSNVEEFKDAGIKVLNSLPITGNELSLELTDYINRIITLSDIEGNILRTVEANGSQISIDISALSSGAYFINISDGKSQVTKKFMIER